MSSAKLKATITIVSVLALVAQVFAPIISVTNAANLVSDFKQCANKDTTIGDCHWIGSIIQQSNSRYFEGMSVPQRTIFTGMTGTNHSLEFSHQATKGGIHAYDWLTSYDQAETAASLAGVAYNDLDGQACNPEIGPPGSLQATCLGMRNGSFSALVNVPDDPYISQHGSTQSRIDAYETQFGNRTIKLYAASAISNATLSLSHTVGNGADTGDSDIKYVLNWTSSSDKVLIEMAGHLSLTGDGNGASWGLGNGSSQISGGPYHFNLSKLDSASLGSQDNQIKGADILPPPPPQNGTLIVIKHVINDNGGTAVAGDFGMNITGTNPSQTEFPGDEAPGTSITIEPGNYSVTEDLFSGYDGSFSTDCVGTIAAGEVKTCTVTNDDRPGTLIVEKVVINDNGGTKLPEDFNFQVNGGNAVGFEADGHNELIVNAGAYSVTEPNFAGYESGYSNCSNLNIPNGGSATCVITNNDIAPSLTLIKVVENNNGGTENPSAWTLTASGPTGFSGQGPTVNNGESFDAGSYQLSESGPGNYTGSNWVCSGGTQLNNQVTLGLGESATCVITNDDDAPSLVLVKEVINNNGGTSVATDWQLSADGPTPITGAGGVASGADFTAGSYTLDESTGPAGYAPSNWVCVGGNQSGNTVALGIGDDAFCTIINDDIAPTLTLEKVVINDNGGNSVAADWMLDADGPTPFSGAGSVTSGSGFSSGTYSMSESGPGGYAASNWSCVGGTQNGSNITVTLAESAVCRITNNDIQPLLTVTKFVINDNGGTAVVADFPLFVDDIQVASGIQNGFNAGSYAISEVNLPGYSASIGGDCDKNGQVTLGIGEAKTCTITNDDIQPLLTVIKIVINDDGGTAIVSDFPLFVDSQSVISGFANGFNAGKHSVSETNLPGYAASFSGDCDDDGSVVLNLADNKTCTITNDDIAPTLTLIKTVINDNGGTMAVNDFILMIDGSNVLSGQSNSVMAGKHHASELGVFGYAASSWGGDCAADGSVALVLAESKTCTITNNDIAPELTVIKHVVNNNGGTAVAGDFTMTVTATNPSQISFPGAEAPGTTINLNAGNYSVGEILNLNYSASASADCSGSIGIGESRTCVITNDDVAATRTLGFWQTHTQFTSTVFAANFPGGMMIGSGVHRGIITNTQLNGASQLFGAYYSSIPYKTTGGKRTNVDKAQMQLLQQLVSAKLNCAAFGCSATIAGMISSADSAYANGNVGQILAYASLLDGYNNSGDSVSVSNTGSATPAISQAWANRIFWDAP